MRRFLMLALTTLLAVGGCSPPPAERPPDPEPAPPPVERPRVSQPESEPPGAPQVVRTGDRILVRAVHEPYLWFAGGSRIALSTETGLWSLDPTGRQVEPLAPPGPHRLLVDAFADGVLYLERHPGAVAAFLARRGEPPLQVALLQHSGGDLPAIPVWAALRDSHLLIGVEGRKLLAVNLASGQGEELGDEPIPVRKGDLALSPARGFLAYKLANRGDGLRLLDLKGGRVRRPSQEAHMAGIAWSPAGDRWAVRAAEPGAPLPTGVGADLAEGGTHLDWGDLAGGLHHLFPPVALELVSGPWWSPDAQWLAVLSGTVTDPEAPQQLWVVDLATEDWHNLGPLPAGGFVTSFHPSEPAIVVHAGRDLQLWPISGDEPLPVDPPWQPGQNSPILLPGGALLYLGAAERAGLYLQKPGAAPAPLLAEESRKGGLTVSGRYAALVRYREGPLHDLLILPLPE